MFVVRSQILRTVLDRFHSSSITPKMTTGDGVGVSLQKVVSVMENFAPRRLAESWDNTGLLVEPYTPRNISQILLTNDLTEEVAQEANSLGCEMIVSYHPPIFAPLKSVVQSSWKEKVVSFLLENRISLYSPHTSWDNVRGGVSDWLGSAFGVADSAVPIGKPQAPDSPDPKVGAGRFLRLQTSISLSEAVERVKKLTGLQYVRLAIARGKSMDDLVGTVALCAGSGASVLKGVNAQLYLTGEMLHHDILDATQSGISVILTNHSDSERGYLRVFSAMLEGTLENEVKVIVSQCDRDPLVTV